jgi:hypothetical protein
MKKKMGNLGKLSQFSGIKSSIEEPAQSSVPKEDSTAVNEQVEEVNIKSLKPKEKLVTVNIKIARHHHQWLNETARTIRDNNLEPVAPGERVFPQHLMGVAIDLLQSSDVDWSQVKSVADLRKHLNL